MGEAIPSALFLDVCYSLEEGCCVTLVFVSLRTIVFPCFKMVVDNDFTKFFFHVRMLNVLVGGEFLYVLETIRSMLHAILPRMKWSHPMVFCWSIKFVICEVWVIFVLVGGKLENLMR